MREEDEDTLLAMQAVNNAAASIVDERLTRLARMIISELSKSMS